VEEVRATSRVVVGVLLIANLGVGQAEQPKDMERWNAIDHLCGDLIFVEQHVDRDKAVVERTKGLKDVALKLYDRVTADCCGSVALAEVKTGRGGKFRFMDVRPGSYWLVTIVGGRQYKMPLRLQPEKSNGTACSAQQFLVYDSGEFHIGQIMILD
jgi:hypothetical protein